MRFDTRHYTITTQCVVTTVHVLYCVFCCGWAVSLRNGLLAVHDDLAFKQTPHALTQRSLLLTLGLYGLAQMAAVGRKASNDQTENTLQPVLDNPFNNF